MRAVLKSPLGIQANVTSVVRDLMLQADGGRYRGEGAIEIQVGIGRRLAKAAGPHAPAVVLVGLADQLPADFVEHLAQIWEVGEPPDYIDDDGLPAFECD